MLLSANKSQTGSRLAKGFAKKYGPKSYVDRFKGAYFVLSLFSWVVAAFLALCSFKFWEALFLTKLSPDLSFWLAIAVTILWVYIAKLLLDTVLRGYHAGDDLDFMLIILAVLFIGGDIYFNYAGIPALSEVMISRPEDQKSSAIDAQLQDLTSQYDQQIKELKHKFYWCSYHKTNHKEHGKCSHEKYWVNAKSKDGKRLRALEDKKFELIASLSKQREAAVSEHTANLSNYYDTLSQRISQMRWLQGAAYGLLLLLSFWMHSFGAKAGFEELSPSPAPAPAPGGGGPGSGLRDEIEELKGLVYSLAAQRAPQPSQASHNGSKGPRILNLFGDNTQSVQPFTQSVQSSSAPEIMLEAEGYVCKCSNPDCGKQYIRKIPPRQGEGTYCGDPCRFAHHAQMRKQAGITTATA